MFEQKVMENVVITVNERVERVQQREQRDESSETNNFRKLLPLLMNKGIDNINLSMFDENTRTKILTILGDEYMRKGDLNNGIKAFVFRVFLFPYSDPTIEQYILHLLNRFFYGSFLVMVIVVILGIIFIKFKNNPEIRREARRL
mgnify:CR=1 FL=1